MVVRAVILGTDCPGIDAPLFALGQLASSIGSRVGYAFASDVWLVLYRALIPTGPPTTTAPRPTAPLATATALASNCGRTQLNGGCYGRADAIKWGLLWADVKGRNMWADVKGRNIWADVN